MGIVLLIIAGMLMFHSGACWERHKRAELTKAGLIATAVIEIFASLYFTIAAIDHYAT